MPYSITENAHAVLFPAFAGVRLGKQVRQFLDRGGCSILLGETRVEYVARKMSPQRVEEETREQLTSVIGAARSRAGSLLAAVDQEPGGICRLHDLVPGFPAMCGISHATPEDVETDFTAVASAAKAIGINSFLSPILDCVTGDNPWLRGRTWSTDPQVIADVSTIFIRSVQAEGIVAVAKHFPGYAHIPLDPAVESEARNTAAASTFDDTFIPFRAAIDCGVEAIMTGPAIVEAFDTENAASVSPAVIAELRDRLGFKGLVVSDDLDSAAILRGAPITDTAIRALRAGSDLLLIADIDDHVEKIAGAIIDAVEGGTLEEARLAEAASKVRLLVQRYCS